MARANSYQSLNSEVREDITSFSHQPIIRHPGDNIRHPGDNFRHPSDNIRHPSDNIRHPGDNIRLPGDNFRQFGENIRQPGNIVRHYGSNIHHHGDSSEEISYKGTQLNHHGDRPSSEEGFASSFVSRGTPSLNESEEHHSHSRSFSADRSRELDLDSNDRDFSSGDPGSGGSGTLRRRYQPSNHGQLGAVRRVKSDKSESTLRRRGRGEHSGRGGLESCDFEPRYTDVRQPRPPERSTWGETPSYSLQIISL